MANGPRPDGAPGDRYAEMGVFPAAVDLALRARVRDFYRVSDDRRQDGRWVGFFTADARVVMGAAGAEGADEIRQLRGTMWTSVGRRRHWITEVFLGESSGHLSDRVEMMLEGMAERMDTDGETYVLSWAGRATWVKTTTGGGGDAQGQGDEVRWKMTFYRVWLMERSELEALVDDG